MDIYPARELPLPGIDSELIRERLTVSGRILSKEALMEYIGCDFRQGILVTMGAGDIDRLGHSIKTQLLIGK